MVEDREEDVTGLWSCVRDAVREGRSGRRGLILRIEQVGQEALVEDIYSSMRKRAASEGKLEG